MSDMNSATRTTAVPGPPTTGTIDNPLCTCCTPQQPLEPPENGGTQYICPVTALKYTFDPAEGIARKVEEASQQTNTSVTGRETGFYPQAPPREEIRTVNPSDTFS